MSHEHEENTRAQHGGLHIDTKIQIVGTMVIWVGIPFTLVALFCFAVFAVYHWSSFVATSPYIVYGVVILLGSLAIILVLSLLVTKVIHPLITGYHRFSEARGQQHQNLLLHTGANYVVFMHEGRVSIQSVIEEKHVYNIKQDDRVGTVGMVDADELRALPAPMHVQSFRELIVAGVLQSARSQGKMLLGYDVKTGALREGSWLDLYSCGIGGVSGSGKTTTVRFLLFQALLADARMLMIDPHINDPDESLAAQFRAFPNSHIAAPCDASITPVLKRVRWLSKELERRKRIGAKTPFIIFVIDEFNAVMRIKDVREEMSTLLVSIAQEGRKFGLFAMLIGQRWSQQDIGGADIRTSLASTLAHRFTDEEQARKLVGSRNGPRCLELPTGHFLFRDTNGGLTEMITPATNIEDGESIRRILAGTGDARSLPDMETTTENSVSPSLSPTLFRPIPILQREAVKAVNAPVERCESGECFTDNGESGESVSGYSSQEEAAILHAAYQLQSENGHVTRSAIRNRLQWNNKQWNKIKAVCDKYSIAS